MSRNFVLLIMTKYNDLYVPGIVKQYKTVSKHMQTVMESHEIAFSASESLDKSNRKC